MASLEVSLPLDSDGFLRRECPQCEQEFKWHHGPANEEAERQPATEIFFCPLCGEPADEGSWWTSGQLALISSAQEMLVARELGEIFGELERETRNNKFVRFKAGEIEEAGVPEPLTETNDMTVVSSPCHAWEPVKVPAHQAGRLFCLVCGNPYAL